MWFIFGPYLETCALSMELLDACTSTKFKTAVPYICTLLWFLSTNLPSPCVLFPVCALQLFFTPPLPNNFCFSPDFCNFVRSQKLTIITGIKGYAALATCPMRRFHSQFATFSLFGCFFLPLKYESFRVSFHLFKVNGVPSLPDLSSYLF